MKIYNYTELTKEGIDNLFSRQNLLSSDVFDIVDDISEQVQKSGDNALRDLTEKLDGVRLDCLSVSEKEFEEASKLVSKELKDSIEIAKDNIYKFHKSRKCNNQKIETTNGVFCWTEFRAIESVGLYIPAGTAPLFSSVLMLAIPALIAGCKKIVFCTPPNKQGEIAPEILWTINSLGLNEVYKVGGAQSIFALTYGTEQVPKVYKIFGPGNQYVTAAKIKASSIVAIDMPAGPSEALVIADENSNAKFAASDLLSQAEHGADSQVVLICNDKSNVDKILEETNKQLKELPRKDIAGKALENSFAIITPNLEVSFELSNLYAPEHLILSLDNFEEYLPSIQNAGSVFCGKYSSESFGDYASGTNHALPTSGFAKSYSGVSVASFGKNITFQEVTREGLDNLGKTVEIMASAEQLFAHKNSVSIRLLEKDDANKNDNRKAKISRTTNETDIAIDLNIDGSGRYYIKTGLNFFDHMLEQLSKHANFDLTLKCNGDLEIDEHHTIEDIAIALGEAFKNALGDKRGIERFAWERILVMDEAKTEVSIDLSGRSFLIFNASFDREYVGDFPIEMLEHFFQSFCTSAGINLSVSIEGKNTHHKVESCFKAFAKCLKDAIVRTGSNINSTKGVL